jgi:eukaryotic-like serine/threonine-protein kinase
VTPEEARETIGQTLFRQGLTETDLAVHGRIAASAPAVPCELQRVAMADAAAATIDLVRGGVLGRGGMGIVYVAEQRSLGRDVAVKVIAKPDDDRRRALVVEGRTMGALEHPNIVPVHALGLDDAGDPVLVMKLVDGVSWRALLDDAAHPFWATIAPDGEVLRASVEILMGVCRALSFAHSRGVVHRDLKPENVMLGRFGEVYLLDWGIALRLDERAREGPGVIGTPGYLAPEMTRGDPRAIDERTDVYLLGATLFELLAGRPPHAAATPMAALISSLMSTVPPLRGDVPSDLAGLARAALDGDPAMRPPSAEAFRTALAAHLTLRAADRLVRSADAAIARANDAAAREGPASATAYRALVEARFALRSALELRPGDARAIERSDACVRSLCEREIALASPVGAREAALELTTPDVALAQRINALEQRVAAERVAAARARVSAAQNDISSAWKVLAAISVVGLAVGVPYSVVTAQTTAFTPPPIEGRAIFWAIIMPVILLGVALGRRKLFATAGSTRLSLALLLWTAVPATVVFACFFAGVPYPVFPTMLAQALVCAVVAVTVLPGVAAAAIAQIALAIAIAAWPDAEVPLIIGASPVVIAILVIALRARNRELMRVDVVPVVG